MGSSLGREIRVERGSGGAKGERQLCVQERKAGPGSAHRGWGGRRAALGKENSRQREESAMHKLFQASTPAHRGHSASSFGLLCTLNGSYVDLGTLNTVLCSPKPGYVQSQLSAVCILNLSERQLPGAKWSLLIFIQIENI